jgi:endonuclease/exonuclease/phosphatase family metal-dependent hydrolase
LTGLIRVFSGNLWLGRAEPEALVELIRRFQIDVFAAQELGHDCAEAISAELPHGCLEPRESYHGMGIAMRHPGSYERIQMAYRDARRVVLDPKDWNGLDRAVDLINVHFQAPHSMKPFPSARVRHQQASAMEAYVAANPSDSRLVVGDYNATPAWPLYQRMARMFEDGAIASAKKAGRRPQPTWGRRPESRRLLRIDHAMVKGMEVEGFQVIDIPGSDHSGILFDCAPAPVTEPVQDTDPIES